MEIRKMKTCNGVGVRLTLMFILAMFAFVGCSAKQNRSTSSPTLQRAEVDSVMRKSLGDSVYNIIVNAKLIQASVISYSNDSIENESTTEVKNIRRNYVPLVQFILSDTKNYEGDLIVYGQYMPCFSLTFNKKKEKCILNFDFGLKKWTICDGNNHILHKYDLPSDNMLRFANIIFPDNELFNNFLNVD